MWWYASPIKQFEYGYPSSNTLAAYFLKKKSKCIMFHLQPANEKRNEVRFPTVNHRFVTNVRNYSMQNEDY